MPTQFAANLRPSDIKLTSEADTAGHQAAASMHQEITEAATREDSAFHRQVAPATEDAGSSKAYFAIDAFLNNRGDTLESIMASFRAENLKLRDGLPGDDKPGVVSALKLRRYYEAYMKGVCKHLNVPVPDAREIR